MGVRTTLVASIGAAILAASVGTANAQVAQSDFNSSAAIERAQSKNGQPYIYGSLNDCSGHLSDVLNAATGLTVRFTTDSDFSALGWLPGYDPNGFNIGTNGGMGENGHMAGTLFGVDIESNGSDGVLYGGTALGARDFPMVWHWPGASSPTPDSAPPVGSYTVVPGDWLTTIAPRVGMTVEAILALNQDSITDPALIFPGQVLRLD